MYNKLPITCPFYRISLISYLSHRLITGQLQLLVINHSAINTNITRSWLTPSYLYLYLCTGTGKMVLAILHSDMANTILYNGIRYIISLYIIER